MKVSVVTESRFHGDAEGGVWTESGDSYPFWSRYLDRFDSVNVIARVSNGIAQLRDEKRVDGPGVSVIHLPYYVGPVGFLRYAPDIRRAVARVADQLDALVFRVPSALSNLIWRTLTRRGRPFGLEVVGDPHEVFAPGVVDHPLRPFFRWHFSGHLRRQCLRASGVAYVTKRALQQRYPTRATSISACDVDLPEEALLGGVLSTHYSSVELDSAYIAECLRKPKQHGPYQLVTVGSLAQLYKGTDVLIEAVARSVRAGVDLTAVVVGDGKYRPDLMAQAERIGMASRIRFAGQVTAGGPVRDILDAADLFVLPSRTEGLPRALIEAMARALPCIGSDVGGIPELLDASELVPAGDPAALATKIQDVLRDPFRMETMSQRNLAGAHEYLDSVLAGRRRRFYQHIRDCTQRWEARQTAAQCERST